MPSALHEEIVDDVVSALAWGRVEEPLLSIGMIREACHAAPYAGVPATGKRADLYLIPTDGYGPIFVEVGDNPRGKWEHVVQDDGGFARVLRIGWEREVSIVHARRTPAEAAIVRAIERWFREPGERERLEQLHASRVVGAG